MTARLPPDDLIEWAGLALLKPSLDCQVQRAYREWTALTCPALINDTLRLVRGLRMTPRDEGQARIALWDFAMRAGLLN